MKSYLTALLLLLVGLSSKAQVQIVSSFLSPYDVSSVALCKVVLNSTVANARVYINGSLTDENGILFAEAKTIQIPLKQGINNIADLKSLITSEYFEHNDIAQYILINHRLPSGKFRHCIKIINVDGETLDERCDEVESFDNSFLTLVSPNDRDTIDTQTPLLTWIHSEPFSLLSPNEYFKLILVEMAKKGQDAEEAVMTQPPHYLNDNIRSHQDLYPSFAKELEESKTYAWQVQKISKTDNSIVQKSEAWSFIVRKPKEEKDNKYCMLKEKPDGAYYTAANRKIFFQFEEDYYSESIKCKIYNDRRELLVPKLLNETKTEEKHATTQQAAINAKTIGYNAYELNLRDYKLKSGYYYMEVLNEKNKKYTLKFYVD